MAKSICIFTNEFPFGEQEAFLENEIDFISKSFDRVYIIPLFKHQKERKLDHSNITVCTPVNSTREITIHKFILLLSLNFWKTFILGFVECKYKPKYLVKILKQSFIISRLKKYLVKRSEYFSVDLWYFYWGTNSVNVLPFLEKHPQCVARFHGYDLYSDDVRKGNCQLFQKRAINKLSKAYFVSQHGQNYIRERFNEFAHKFMVSRLGVPERGISKPSSDGILRILSCSNIYSVKRVHRIAQAIAEIKDIKIEWTHIGDGPNDQKKKIFNALEKSADNIKFNFMGRISNKLTMAYYVENPVDLFINVSQSEGLPVSIMEAYSFGVPVIATDVGGSSELVDESCGKLIKASFSNEELVEEIRDFYKRKDYSLKENAITKWNEIANSEINYTNFVEGLIKI